MSEYVIAHHGIKGQKWGVRRYQNADGSLTSSGKRRYGYKNFEKRSLEDRFQSSKALKGQSNFYKDVKKAIKKENPKLSKEERELKIRDEYDKLFDFDSNQEDNLIYDVHKSAYNIYNASYNLGALLGPLGGATVALLKTKEDRKKWEDTTNKIIDEIRRNNNGK